MRNEEYKEIVAEIAPPSDAGAFDALSTRYAVVPFGANAWQAVRQNGRLAEWIPEPSVFSGPKDKVIRRLCEAISSQPRVRFTTPEGYKYAVSFVGQIRDAYASRAQRLAMDCVETFGALGDSGNE